MKPRAPIVLGATAAGLAAVLSFHPHQALRAAIPAPAPAASAGSGGGSGGSSAGGGSSGARTSGSARTITGAVEVTRYGPVQVRVTMKGGRITDVTALQLPADRPRSTQISSQAAPLLRQEALSAQSASIHVISGATFTSAGYQASLQAALQRA